MKKSSELNAVYTLLIVTINHDVFQKYIYILMLKKLRKLTSVLIFHWIVHDVSMFLISLHAHRKVSKPVTSRVHSVEHPIILLPRCYEGRTMVGQFWLVKLLLLVWMALRMCLLALLVYGVGTFWVYVLCLYTDKNEDKNVVFYLKN